MPDHPAGSRATRDRSITVCETCGLDEAVLHAHGILIMPDDWPLNGVAEHVAQGHPAPTVGPYANLCPIPVDTTVVARLDAVIAHAHQRELDEAEENGLTSYSGLIDFVLDIAEENGSLF